eukprot:TRINITY_DN40475_c0_g1_i1.p1 TRINITY_DN40475_c0_g1~~TRINITY_DN40475_c0_g1_i1.p1  ORF type:complete len:183 (+),score=56.96 TRINITY_DN40475_c0_g1_i1:111-659(+)
MTIVRNSAADLHQKQIVPVEEHPSQSGSIVEYKAKESASALLKEEEEDLEVKLRRIIEHVPVRVSNTSGSSAGSGSGDFHQYRQMRRKEQDRLSRMDSDYQRRKELAEFNARREERLKAAEERTARKRAKRQKKKERKRAKKKNQDSAVTGQPEGQRGNENNSDEDSTDDDSTDEHQNAPEN